MYCPTIVQHPEVICFKQACHDKLIDVARAAFVAIRNRVDMERK